MYIEFKQKKPPLHKIEKALILYLILEKETKRQFSHI